MNAKGDEPTPEWHEVHVVRLDSHNAFAKAMNKAGNKMLSLSAGTVGLKCNGCSESVLASGLLIKLVKGQADEFLSFVPHPHEGQQTRLPPINVRLLCEVCQPTPLPTFPPNFRP